MNTVLYILLLSFTTLACPQALRIIKSDYLKGMTLCQAHDRYQQALSTLKAKGISHPERIAGLIGPRFIHFADWQKLAEKNKYNPWYIYQPAPLTWEKWELGAKIIDNLTEKNLKTTRIETISMVWLQQLHGETLDGLLSKSGVFRSGIELGKAFEKKTSLSREQIEGINNLPYKSSAIDREALVRWTPTQCLEEKSEAEIAAYRASGRYLDLSKWPMQSPAKFFIGETGEERQCGYIIYSRPSDLEPQLAQWFEFVNASIKSINRSDSDIDPIFIAAKSQQWFIAIHPYLGGNGRLSRFIMDYFTKSLGLPAPILKDQNEDIYQSPESWAGQVGKGVEYAVRFAEYCASGGDKGCNIVPFNAVKN